MTLYYRAEAHEDLSQNDADRAGMQQVVGTRGRLASQACLIGGFPTVLAAAYRPGSAGPREHGK
ncbi:hypothetical protein [Streptomyces sp. MMS24-I29]|uniref:hypothetical protein n=1 Tax=Streptomyces sp. MMS24-I29 TaxID=3351480 RepID=UPI003C7D7D9B